MGRSGLAGLGLAVCLMAGTARAEGSDGPKERRQVQIDSTTAICMAQDSKKQAIQAMAKERKYAKKYGTLNVQVLDDLKHQIMADDWVISVQTGMLSKYGAKKTSCSDPAVVALTDCLEKRKVTWITGDFDFWDNHVVDHYDACHAEGVAMAE